MLLVTEANPGTVWTVWEGATQAMRTRRRGWQGSLKANYHSASYVIQKIDIIFYCLGIKKKESKLSGCHCFHLSPLHLQITSIFTHLLLICPRETRGAISVQAFGSLCTRFQTLLHWLFFSLSFFSKVPSSPLPLWSLTVQPALLPPLKLF